MRDYSSKTAGIVLGTVKYGDCSIIVNVLTELLGRQGYIVKLSSNKRKSMLPLFQPLTIVELEGKNNSHSALQNLLDVHVNYPLINIPCEPVRQSLAMFMSELLIKTIETGLPDVGLYDYVSKSVMVLEQGVPGIYNFHLCFMYRLMGLLGFEPDMNYCGEMVFDMVEGVYTSKMPCHNHILSGDEIRLWRMLPLMDVDRLEEVRMTRAERMSLITMMEEYYSIHVSGFSGLTTVSVLHQLF